VIIRDQRVVLQALEKAHEALQKYVEVFEYGCVDKSGIPAGLSERCLSVMEKSMGHCHNDLLHLQESFERRVELLSEYIRNTLVNITISQEMMNNYRLSVDHFDSGYHPTPPEDLSSTEKMAAKQAEEAQRQVEEAKRQEELKEKEEQDAKLAARHTKLQGISQEMLDMFSPDELDEMISASEQLAIERFKSEREQQIRDEVAKEIQEKLLREEQERAAAKKKQEEEIAKKLAEKEKIKAVLAEQHLKQKMVTEKARLLSEAQKKAAKETLVNNLVSNKATAELENELRRSIMAG